MGREGEARVLRQRPTGSVHSSSHYCLSPSGAYLSRVSRTFHQDALEQHVNTHHVTGVGGPGADDYHPSLTNDALATHVASAEAALAAAEAAAGRSGAPLHYDHASTVPGRGADGGGYADMYESRLTRDATSFPTPSPPQRTHIPTAGRRSRQAGHVSRPDWDADTDVADVSVPPVSHVPHGGGGGVTDVGRRPGRRAVASADIGAGWNDDVTISYSPPETREARGNGSGHGDDDALGHVPSVAPVHYGRRGVVGAGAGHQSRSAGRSEWDTAGDLTGGPSAGNRPPSTGNRSVRTASKLAALKGRRRAAQAATMRPVSREDAGGGALRQPRSLFETGGALSGAPGGGGSRQGERTPWRFDEDAPTTASNNWGASGPPSEYAASEPLRQCDGCGRRFNERALRVHSRSCKGVARKAAEEDAANGDEWGGGGRRGGSSGVTPGVGRQRGDGAGVYASWGDDVDPYSQSDRGGKEYDPASLGSRTRRPARLHAHAQRQRQAESPPREPETPSPLGGGGYGGGGYGRQTATANTLPPEMAGMSIPEGADAPAPGALHPCDLCGRKFNEKALKVHSRICAKVFVNKRKEFDMKGQRADGTDLEQFQRENKYKSGSRGGRQPLKQRSAEVAAAAADRDARSAQGAAGKVPKWKRQSEMFRAGLRAARGVATGSGGGGRGGGSNPSGGGGGFGGGGAEAYPAADEFDDRVQCPHCSRKFNEDVLERHLPHCKNMKARPTTLKRGGGRGAHSLNPRKENSAPAYPRKGVAAPRRGRA